MLCSVIPAGYPYVVMLQNALMRHLAASSLSAQERKEYRIIDEGTIHMARMAIFAGHAVNGVAKILSLIHI